MVLEASGAGTVRELVERYRSGDSLHLFLQLIANGLSERHPP